MLWNSRLSPTWTNCSPSESADTGHRQDCHPADDRLGTPAPRCHVFRPRDRDLLAAPPPLLRWSSPCPPFLPPCPTRAITCPPRPPCSPAAPPLRPRPVPPSSIT